MMHPCVEFPTVPTAHSMHALAPQSDTSPSGQAVQASSPPAEKLFTGHCTGGIPLGQKCPAGHGAHPVALSNEYHPDAQAVQLSQASAENVPERHARQCDDPAAAQNPAAHASGTDVPVTAQNVPPGHTVQLAHPSSAYVVGRHAVLAPPVHECPASHGTQLLAPTSEYVPSGQAMHSDAPRCPTYVPAAHGSMLVDPFTQK
mmetsp:Transcript_58863/g.140573  ORF Transcript_58863/g.140573 Transcript_58863/m.140573 type:complete len:202 (-) Transcript_58863:213-818(-)